MPETGIVTNHHFNPLDTENAFLFSGGVYSLELVAKVVGSKRLVSLWTIEVEMPDKAYATSIARETAVFYSWSSEQNRYVASIESRSGAVHALSDPGG